jgi:multidrug efflux pump subunit AcrB
MKSAIAWMVKNPVAANLMMMLFIAGGLIYGGSIKQEVFPEIELDAVTVAVTYPGAGPEEVESGVCLPIEEAIFSIEGIKEISCTATEGVGALTAELLLGTDIDQALQEVKAEIDRIQTFPEDAEDPQVSRVVPRQPVISLALYGDISEGSLRQQAELIRDELLDKPGITQVEFSGVRDYEITVEVSESTLQKYGLTLAQIAQRIRSSSVDVPAGVVKTSGGEVLLRTKEKKYTGAEYAKTSIVSLADGTDVSLGQLANIKDDFADNDQRAEYAGKRAAMIEVFRVGDQRPLQIAEQVRDYVEDKREILPPGIAIDVWSDRSELLNSRMQLLLSNAYLGLFLVFVVLGLFLEIRLAFWVTMGIPISFLGALFFLPAFDVTINMISLFAFILALGIVVDDAIIVGENIYEHRDDKGSREDAAIRGAHEVGGAVVFSVLTTVAAFLPMLFVTGMMGKFMRVIPVIVISTLLLSLFESLFILPAHLAHSKKAPLRRGVFHRLELIRLGMQERLENFVAGPYARSLKLSMKFRYTTISIAIGFLVIVVGLMKGGYLKTVHMPKVDAEVVTASLSMAVGAPIAETERMQAVLSRAAERTIEDFSERYANGDRGKVTRGMYSVIGSSMRSRGHRSSSSASGSHLAAVAVYLQPSDVGGFSSHEFANAWREASGELAGVESLTFKSSLIGMGEAVDIQLAHSDYVLLEKAAERVKQELAKYKGVSDVADSFSDGKRELRLRLRPEARSFGTTETQLGRQIRGAFYGEEALRFQRGRDELRVMVRYPESERRSLGSIESLRVRTGDGAEVPLAQVAEVIEGTGYNQIKRINRKRVINVTADVDMKLANPKEIITKVSDDILPLLHSDFPGLLTTVEGEERERSDSMDSLFRGFYFVLLLVYVLLAIPFKSYTQPFIVMSAIPFGFVGAAIGHILIGKDISLLSFCGLVALTGVVVNDSLIMVDYINRRRRAGDSIFDAVFAGGTRRFRPIILTSLTTFLGLAPIIFETSLQAQFLIPMAISLGFGVLFATGITLYLIPSIYLVLEDGLSFLARLRGVEDKPTSSKAIDVPQPGVELQ